MPCPRCSGLSMRVEVYSEGVTIEADRCVLCGNLFGEMILDYHHSLTHPPQPTPRAHLPVWDPAKRRLKIPAILCLSETPESA
jgi:hypothetical protein